MDRGPGEEEARRERRPAPIERFNANDEYLRKLEARRRETGQLPEKELAREIELERQRTRRDPGAMPSQGKLGLRPLFSGCRP